MLYQHLKTFRSFVILPFLFLTSVIQAQSFPAAALNNYNINWDIPSINAASSMPCGGGDIGLNVWVENGDLLFYIAQSGTFDENNALLKLGRVRVHLTPNPLSDRNFRQQLRILDGSIYITGKHGQELATIHVWVEVFRPVIHVEIDSRQKIKAIATYESWRTKDHIVRGKENNENSYKFAPQGITKVFKDHINFEENKVIFYHRNRDTTIFDVTVKQQKLDSVKSRLFNPLKQLTFGGFMEGVGFEAYGMDTGKYLETPFVGFRLKSKHYSRHIRLLIGLNVGNYSDVASWHQKLMGLKSQSPADSKVAWQKNQSWWTGFWNRSFIIIDPRKRQVNDTPWTAARNYQLFRYMLACNAYGSYPTKFNGGLFTFDPVLIDSSFHFTPDFRNWGGGTFTQQNQRLVYYPMLKSGDYDMMESAFQFYRRLLPAATLRTKVYWHHDGASFTEQLENFGLPNASEYGWKRPKDYDPGMQYNAWLEYEWDTVLEFCDMMLQSQFYNGTDIYSYLPFIKSCLTFFDEHYRYLARKRGVKVLDSKGHLILFPGSAAETYKMAYNPSSTIAALQTVLTHLLALPANYLTSGEKEKWEAMYKTIPPIPFHVIHGDTAIAPAEVWERINNVETPQLYPVFPWGIYGVGKPNLQYALNTWYLDSAAVKNRSYVGWKQDNIFAARLGLTEQAAQLTLQKLSNSQRRFPAFWGPGFDWTPDHNWGGSAMIGLQEMLLQTNGKKILLFPAWPLNWDVHFKLHAPYQTTVEATLENGKITQLIVTPESRKKDIDIYLTHEAGTLQ